MWFKPEGIKKTYFLLALCFFIGLGVTFFQKMIPLFTVNQWLLLGRLGLYSLFYSCWPWVIRRVSNDALLTAHQQQMAGLFRWYLLIVMGALEVLNWGIA